MEKKSQGSRFRIVLVEPEYEINLGAVARAMKNFGFSDLAIVSPNCDPRGFDAIMHSKHAREILEGAKICKSLPAATRGCKFVVGTTGIIYRHWHQTIRSPISLEAFAKKAQGASEGKFALVFGNEGVGLSEKDISSCDFLITIPTADAYPVLNLSHAVAITLYELSAYAPRAYVPSGEREKEALVGAFSLITDKFSSELRNPKKVKVAFRRIIGKAMPTDKECAAVLGVLRRAERELQKKENKKSEASQNKTKTEKTNHFFLLFTIFTFVGVSSILSVSMRAMSPFILVM
ncbi:MAG: RNA methyltransferase [Candidatus Micrarchaeota archaeon]|nr:RNA methyltransferase [Candidatus Micrarchaeota archaeon]